MKNKGWILTRNKKNLDETKDNRGNFMYALQKYRNYIFTPLNIKKFINLSNLLSFLLKTHLNFIKYSFFPLLKK